MLRHSHFTAASECWSQCRYSPHQRKNSQFLKVDHESVHNDISLENMNNTIQYMIQSGVHLDLLRRLRQTRLHFRCCFWSKYNQSIEMTHVVYIWICFGTCGRIQRICIKPTTVTHLSCTFRFVEVPVVE